MPHDPRAAERGELDASIARPIGNREIILR